MRAICLIFLCVALICSLNTGELWASQSPVVAPCPFVGKVLDRKIRREDGQGISEGQTLRYVDITIKIAQAILETKPRCDFKKGQDVVVQMHGSVLGFFAPGYPIVGQCVKGFAQYSADGNFMSGNWLTVEEKLAPEQCE